MGDPTFEDLATELASGSNRALEELLRLALHRASERDLPVAAIEIVVTLAEAAPPSSEAVAVAARVAERVPEAHRAMARAQAGALAADRGSARRNLADPTLPFAVAGVWLGVLHPDEEVLAPWLARAGEAADRWAALASVVRHLPEPVGAQLLRDAARGDEIFSVPQWALDREGWRALVRAEQDPGFNAFTAWRLGWAARRGPKEDRSEVLDRAIDAFDRIVSTPMDPGNDEGPFCDIADLLDPAQVARAWAVVDRMAVVPGWDVDPSRAWLAARRAAFGEEVDPEVVPSPWRRAWLRGRVLGERLRRGARWSAPPADEVVALLCGLASVIDVPTPETLDAALDLARSADDPDHARTVLAQAWSGSGAVERWVTVAKELVRDDDRLDLLLALVERDPDVVSELVPLDGLRWPDLVPIAAHVPRDVLVRAFVEWLQSYTRGAPPNVWWDWSGVPLVEGLVALAGPEAPLTAVRAIRRWLDEVLGLEQ